MSQIKMIDLLLYILLEHRKIINLKLHSAL